jgi:hypothetical protein
MPILVIQVPPPPAPSPAVSGPQAVPTAFVWDYLYEAWSPNTTNPPAVPPGTQVKLQLDTTLGEVSGPLVALDAAPIVVKTDANGFWSVYLTPGGDIQPAAARQVIYAPADNVQIPVGDTGPQTFTSTYQAFEWGCTVRQAGANLPTFYLESLVAGVWQLVDGPIGGQVTPTLPFVVQSAVVAPGPFNNSPLRIRWTSPVGWDGAFFIFGDVAGPVYRVITSARVFRIFVPPNGGQARKLIV